jgi:hypothetical protein
MPRRNPWRFGCPWFLDVRVCSSGMENQQGGRRARVRFVVPAGSPLNTNTAYRCTRLEAIVFLSCPPSLREGDKSARGRRARWRRWKTSDPVSVPFSKIRERARGSVRLLSGLSTPGRRVRWVGNNGRTKVDAKAGVGTVGDRRATDSTRLLACGSADKGATKSYHAKAEGAWCQGNECLESVGRSVGSRCRLKKVTVGVVRVVGERKKQTGEW